MCRKVDVPTCVMAPGHACGQPERTNTARAFGTRARQNSLTHTFSATFQLTTRFDTGRQSQ